VPIIQPDDIEAAISRVRDFMDVQGSGITQALELHLQAAGITLPAVFKLAEHLMASQDAAVEHAVTMLATQAAATTAIAAEIAREREAR
jgi:hypothetical protein